MSSTTGSNADSTMSGSWARCGSRRFSAGANSRWDTMNVGVMALGFIVFPLLGLAVLGWILSGRHVRDLPAAIQSVYSRFFGNSGVSGPTNNIVFNEYQQTQYDRISEIKNEIGERARRFREFRENVQRRADREEFDRFMADAPGSPDRNG